MEFPHKGPECVALMFALLLAWTRCWTYSQYTPFQHKWPVTRKMFPFEDVIMKMDAMPTDSVFTVVKMQSDGCPDADQDASAWQPTRPPPWSMSGQSVSSSQCRIMGKINVVKDVNILESVVPLFHCVRMKNTHKPLWLVDLKRTNRPWPACGITRSTSSPSAARL